jgi:putative transposase
VVITSVRREVVDLFKSRGHSERRACFLASLHRSTCQYQHRRADDPDLVAKLRELASERPRYGYRRLHVLLRRDERYRSVNRKRVYRLYKAAGLAVRRRSRKKARFTRPAPPAPVTRPNERWSMDFVHDSLSDGRTFRTFNVVDAYTRECLAIEVDTSLPAARIVRVLDKLVWQHNPPESLRVDNGPEFISTTLEAWATQHGVKLDFIQPGKPTQNAHVESFNGRFRDECLAQARFPTLARARAEIEIYRVDYNCVRPHSSLDYRTPEAFGLIARRQVPPSAGAAAALFGGDVQGSASHLDRNPDPNQIEVH